MKNRNAEDCDSLVVLAAQGSTACLKEDHMTHTTKHLLAAALAFAAASSQATGQAQATATLSGVQFQLIDLNISDGIAPSISFAFPQRFANAQVQASWSLPDEGQFASGQFSTATNPWSPRMTEANTMHSSSSAVISGDSTFAGAVLSTGGQASPPSATTPLGPDSFWSAGSSFTTWLNAPQSGVTNFELSPFSLVIFTATVDVRAVASGGLALSQGGSFFQTQPNRAFASAGLRVSGPSSGGGSGIQTSTDARSLSAITQFNSQTGTWTAANRLDSGTVAVSFLNLTASAVQASFGFDLNTSGNVYGTQVTMAQPIPEPGTWALLAAGLLFVARRVSSRP